MLVVQGVIHHSEAGVNRGDSLPGNGINLAHGNDATLDGRGSPTTGGKDSGFVPLEQIDGAESGGGKGEIGAQRLEEWGASGLCGLCEDPSGNRGKDSQVVQFVWLKSWRDMR